MTERPVDSDTNAENRTNTMDNVFKMKLIPFPSPSIILTRRITRSAYAGRVYRIRTSLAIAFSIIGCVLSAASIFGTINHPPTISWIPDQRSTNGNFNTVFFQCTDDVTSLNTTNLAKATSNSTFCPTNKITIGQCTGAGAPLAGCPASDWWPMLTHRQM